MAELFKVHEKNGAFLATMPAPKVGLWGDHDFRWLAKRGVNVVVSLLEAHEVQMLRLQKEEALCEEEGLAFRSFPIMDHSTPKSAMKTAELCNAIHQDLLAGRSTAIHCLAGIGRSSVIAACVMLLEGITYEDAFLQISQARGLPVPDMDAQRLWVKENRHTIAPRPRD